MGVVWCVHGDFSEILFALTGFTAGYDNLTATTGKEDPAPKNLTSA